MRDGRTSIEPAGAGRAPRPPAEEAARIAGDDARDRLPVGFAPPPRKGQIKVVCGVLVALVSDRPAASGAIA